MASIPIGQLANYTATARKPNLIDFGNFSPNDNLSFIATGLGAGFAQVSLVGTPNGVQTTFSVPVPIPHNAAILNNGIVVSTSNYTLSGTTVTFASTYIPQTGDDLEALIS